MLSNLTTNYLALDNLEICEGNNWSRHLVPKD